MKIECLHCGQVFHGNTKDAFMEGWELAPVVVCPTCQKPRTEDETEEDKKPVEAK